MASVKKVPDATIRRPTDVIVRITSTNICGSALYTYERRAHVEAGRTRGNENLGEVADTGNAVEKIKVGDRVSIPLSVSCGNCKNCERGLPAFCLTVNPGRIGAGYGFADMGPFDGGQAEYLRVPYGDFNCLRLPADATSYPTLSDFFPAGWRATDLSDLKPGDSILIYGLGLAGLMAAHAAVIKGASKVMVVDRHPDRLRLAEQIWSDPDW
jgi:threonine dehydrogenase-like Zn-dependent dehydrogenase